MGFIWDALLITMGHKIIIRGNMRYMRYMRYMQRLRRPARVILLDHIRN